MRRLLLMWHRRIGLVFGLWVALAALTALMINHKDAIEALLSPPAPPLHEGGSASPYSQYLLSVATDPSNQKNIWLGTASALFVSHDGGRSWTEVNLPLAARQVVSLVFDPVAPSRLLVGLRRGAIFESTDHGATFHAFGAPWLQSTPPEIVAIGFTPRGTLTVATTAGLYTQQAEEAAESALEGWSLIACPPQKNSPSTARRVLRLAYGLHDGQIWGRWGLWITDLTALAMLTLVGSGLLVYRPFATARKQESPEAEEEGPAHA